MRLRRFVQVVDTHTAGEPTRVVLTGIPPIPGRTMEERRRWLAENADDFRRFLLREPRGHADMFGAIVTPPCSPGADFGVIFLDNGGYLGMCGHGAIGVVTALATLGWTDKDELLLDTPSGPVHCRAVPDKKQPVTDTVGAGDGFAAMAAASILNKIPTQKAIHLAQTFASRICSIWMVRVAPRGLMTTRSGWIPFSIKEQERQLHKGALGSGYWQFK